MRRSLRSVLIFCAACLVPAPALAQADYAREKRWADEVAPNIVVGDAVRLQSAAGRSFLAIYTDAPKATGGVIVVHGLGVHPDWELIGTLRTRLADAGFGTLSVQMPVLAADALGEHYPPLFPEAAERLTTAVAWLRGRGIRKVAIVSHSMGARMVHYFLVNSRDPGVDAWVAIGLSSLPMKPAVPALPVLDLFGERDTAAVLANAEQRAAVLRAVRGSAQVRVASADHYFRDAEQELVRQVRLFLDRSLN